MRRLLAQARREWNVLSGGEVRDAEIELGEHIGRGFALGIRTDIEWWPHKGWQFVVRYADGPMQVRAGRIGSLHRMAMAALRATE